MKKVNHIPPIHQKAKKNDMWFPYTSIGLLFAFLILTIIHTLNFFPSFTLKVNLTNIAGSFIAIYALVWQIYNAIKAQKVVAKLELIPYVENSYVMFSCTITNMGTKSIYPYMVNLYVDEGVFSEADSIYIFDPITNHKIDRGTGEVFDCHLAEHCKSENVGEDGHIEFPKCQDKMFNDCERYCCNLRQLSHFTLVHIVPGETFKEDVVMKIDTEGVYRATLIFTGKSYNDCICTSSVFRIIGDEK